MAIDEIRVDEVVVGERLRPLSEATVAEIAASMQRLGQLQPISIHQPDDTPYLVAGHHRLAAAKLLGWAKIKATVLPADMAADDIKLAEIDENLARAELSPAQRSAHMEARRAIFERINGPAKANSARAANKTMGRGDVTANLAATFVQDTASTTGQSERGIRRDIQRARAIPQIADLAGTSLDTGAELDALAKLPAERQAALIERAKAGEQVSAKGGGQNAGQPTIGGPYSAEFKKKVLAAALAYGEARQASYMSYKLLQGKGQKAAVDAAANNAKRALWALESVLEGEDDEDDAAEPSAVQ